jgi:glucose dehydrogenase
MRVRLAKQAQPPDHWLASLFLALGGLLAFRSSASYVVYSKRRPVLQQVVYIYAFVLALGFAWWNFGSNPKIVNLAAVGLLVALPFFLRKFARSRAEQAGTEYTPG